MEDFYKTKIGNESLHEISNVDDHFPTSKNLNIMSAMSLYLNINKFTWTLPDEGHNQIYHILMNRRRH
jgi:hypothetical protein